MATTKKKSPAAGKTSGSKTSKSTPVRNTPLPRSIPAIAAAAAPVAARIEASNEAIAARAYQIYLSGNGGSEMENWLRAERELRGA